MTTPYRVTTEFWDHATLWSDDDSEAGHSTDGGRVFGITRTRYVECDRYGCKPVAVIDPEDREQVERLARGYVAVFNIDKVNMVAIADAIQQALRAFADPKPPKPDEPMGLGAVAEQHGCRWTHVGNGRWVQCLSDGRVSNGRNWEDFTSVAVLSEGVAL